MNTAQCQQEKGANRLTLVPRALRALEARTGRAIRWVAIILNISITVDQSTCSSGQRGVLFPFFGRTHGRPLPTSVAPRIPLCPHVLVSSITL